MQNYLYVKVKILATEDLIISTIKINFVESKTRRMHLIEHNLQQIIELCKKYRVKTLSVFGSILTDRFNDESDVDFLVNFLPYDPNSLEFDYVSNYLDFAESLEDLFGRKVDLVVESGLRNKYFIANVNRTKQLIYG